MMVKKWDTMTAGAPTGLSKIVSLYEDEATYVKDRFRRNPHYDKLSEAFPYIDIVLEELPDISNVYKLIWEIRAMMADAVCEARHLPHGSLIF